MLFMEAHCPCRKAQRRSAPCELYGADDECRHLRKHSAQRRAEETMPFATMNTASSAIFAAEEMITKDMDAAALPSPRCSAPISYIKR